MLSGPHVVRAGEGDITGEPGLLDRYLIESAASSGRVALMEHVLAPKALAAPMHRHSREDEYTYVLAGTLGVIGEVAEPRRRWHTFWNAGDDELRVLEIIVSAGIEALFRRLAELVANTPRIHFPLWRPSTAPRWTSRQRCRW
ncbi:cupin domain-containing protein [Pseudarthrobacter sp. NamB4]|uniref:cupin domain-containing protein n=1 Tax=Pseudarthrobacter sp. NamB4 TaxID=2576837 RepID=UPI00197AF800|nr:cupin domain-containing protein [Pseudarthrobacter sp. NamB4]